MTVTPTSVLALVGWALALVGGLGGLLLRVAWPAPILPTTFGVGPTALVAIAALGITWSTVGALLVIRRPDNPVGRVMILVGAGLAMSVLTVAVAFAALAEGTASGREVASVAGGMTAMLTPILVLVFYLAFVFPTGRGHTARWDTLSRAFLWLAMVPAVLLVLQPGDVHLLPGIRNPIGFGPDLRPVFGERMAGGVETVVAAFLAPLLVLSVASRYRLAGRIERQQLKWFILATAVTVGAGTVMSAGVALTRRPMGETPLIVFALAGTMVPVAIGIAILRYHLYDIDRIISRSLAYVLVSGVLLVVFAVTLLGLSLLLGSLAQGGSLAVAASTLVVFALFGPLRRWAQSIIDRRFDRSHYDASVTVHALTIRLRDDIDLERVEADVLGVVGRTFHPTSTGLWLRRNETSAPRSSVTIPERYAATVTST